MKNTKKQFILIFGLFVLSLLFTSCEEEYEQVDDLWENLRNTVWKKDSDSAREYIIGFYGPRNGPNKNSVYVGNDPYVYYVEVGPIYNGSPIYTNKGPSRGLQFDRTGNEIRLPDLIDDDGKSHKLANRISISGNTLTIKGVKKHDWNVAEKGTYTKVSSDPNYNWDIY